MNDGIKYSPFQNYVLYDHDVDGLFVCLVMKVPEEMRRGTATIGEESSVPVGEQGMTLEEMITHEHWISYQGRAEEEEEAAAAENSL